ncbi:MAG: hypothetical protein ABI862_14935 [Ilumatobacteraceae bacterium]
MATDTQQETRMSVEPGLRRDPTVATNEAVERAMISERDYVDGVVHALKERLDGMDKATMLRLALIDHMPAMIDEKIGHSVTLTTERFASVATQFKERDTRSERESRDNKVAVDAAFAAQKEAAAKQDEANQKSIDKSEKATNESINKLGAAGEAANRALGDKLDDIKDRLVRLEDRTTKIEATKVGGQESIAENRAAANQLRNVIAFGMSLILASIVIIGVIIAAKTGTPAP